MRVACQNSPYASVIPFVDSSVQTYAVHFSREFLGSKKSAVLLKGGTRLLHCLGNGRVVEVVDLDFASSGPVSDRILGPLGQISTLNYSYGHGAVTAILTRQGEVLVAMGARICFSWDTASWRVYPAMRLADQLSPPADARVHRQGEGAHQDDILLGTSPRLH